MGKLGCACILSTLVCMEFKRVGGEGGQNHLYFESPIGFVLGLYCRASVSPSKTPLGREEISNLGVQKEFLKETHCFYGLLVSEKRLFELYLPICIKVEAV